MNFKQLEYFVAVADAGSRYLDGEISLEEAAKEAIQQVNLYLSE